MDRREAAALLGMPRKEIRSVDENWIVTSDGSMHEVPAGPVSHWVRTNPKQTPPRYHPEYVVVEADEDDDEDDLGDDAAGDGVPDGTAKQILDWAAEDPEQASTRARAALAAEQAKGGAARTSLVAALEKLTG